MNEKTDRSGEIFRASSRSSIEYGVFEITNADGSFEVHLHDPERIYGDCSVTPNARDAMAICSLKGSGPLSFSAYGPDGKLQQGFVNLEDPRGVAPPKNLRPGKKVDGGWMNWDHDLEGARPMDH